MLLLMLLPVLPVHVAVIVLVVARRDSVALIMMVAALMRRHVHRHL